MFEILKDDPSEKMVLELISLEKNKRIWRCIHLGEDYCDGFYIAVGEVVQIYT